MVGRQFSLLVKPAAADCNLRCAYCFYLGRGSLYPQTARHRMSDEILERLTASFMRTSQRQYSFGWQGGEPTLMGVDFFRRVVALQKKHGHSGAVVGNGLQTNGILIDDEFAAFLAAYNFLVGVSIDGPAEIHDRYRVFADGSGSHERMMKGVAAMRRHHVSVNALTLVNNINVVRPRQVYRYLRDTGFLYHQYIECVEFDDHGQLQPFAITGEQWGDFLCELFDEWYREDTRRVSVRLFDAVLANMLDCPPAVCVMAPDCRQYFVVEHNGDIYPCDFFVRPELRLGNVATHDWSTLSSSPLYCEFGAGKGVFSDVCRECSYLRYCGGDCQKNRLGGCASRISALCAGWRQFYVHTLERFSILAESVRRERGPVSGTSGIGASEPPGRNDPCPCGSGKKFKKCCMDRSLAVRNSHSSNSNMPRQRHNDD